jgi:hypothetical protein
MKTYETCVLNLDFVIPRRWFSVGKNGKYQGIVIRDKKLILIMSSLAEGIKKKWKTRCLQNSRKMNI